MAKPKKKRKPQPPKVKRERMHEFFKLLEMPVEVLSEEIHIEMYANRRIIIEEAKGIMDYDDRLVRVNAGKYCLRVEGRELNLSSMTTGAIIVNGIISSVEFEL